MAAVAEEGASALSPPSAPQSMLGSAAAAAAELVVGGGVGGGWVLPSRTSVSTGSRSDSASGSSLLAPFFLLLPGLVTWLLLLLGLGVWA